MKNITSLQVIRQRDKLISYLLDNGFFREAEKTNIYLTYKKLNIIYMEETLNKVKIFSCGTPDNLITLEKNSQLEDFLPDIYSFIKQSETHVKNILRNNKIKNILT